MKPEFAFRTQLSFWIAAIAIALRMTSDWLFATGGPLPYQILQAVLLIFALILIWPNREIIFLKGGNHRMAISIALLMLPAGILAGLGIAFVQFGGPHWPSPVQAITIIANNLFFPAVEELEFRGFLLGWMIIHKLRPSLAIWLIAVIHTLAHPHYLLQGNYIFLISILFIFAWLGWLTIRYKSLWGAYVAHALWNSSLFIPLAGMRLR